LPVSAAGTGGNSGAGKFVAQHSFPYISTVILVLIAVAVAAGWRPTGVTHTEQIVALFSALGLWLVHRIALVSGDDIQERISEKFDAALRDRSPRVWIGGIRWSASGGELRRIVYASDSGALVAPESTTNERHARELIWQRRRRWAVIAFAFFAVLNAIDPRLAPGEAVSPSAIVMLTGLTICVVWEILYRLGLQRLPGAMVLDPFPDGSEEVESQKAHGNARLASLAETLAAASGKNVRRSSLHDQEF
jgi:hypothetical protein